MYSLSYFERQNDIKKFVPSVIIMKDHAVSLSVSRYELERELFQYGFKSKVYQIGDYKCIARDIQIHPVLEKAMHIDFLEVSNNQIVKARVPVHFINRDLSEDLKFGSMLNIQFSHIVVKVHAHSIPHAFEIDLQYSKSKFHISDIIDFEKFNILHILNVQHGQSIATIIRSRGAKQASADNAS